MTYRNQIIKQRVNHNYNKKRSADLFKGKKFMEAEKRILVKNFHPSDDSKQMFPPKHKTQVKLNSESETSVNSKITENVTSYENRLKALEECVARLTTELAELKTRFITE